MDFLIIIVQVIRDLLSSLNPFKIFGKDQANSFRSTWKTESKLSHIAFIIGVLLLTLFLAILVLLLLTT
jgi:hypothetical protein